MAYYIDNGVYPEENDEYRSEPYSLGKFISLEINRKAK